MNKFYTMTKDTHNTYIEFDNLDLTINNIIIELLTNTYNYDSVINDNKIILHTTNVYSLSQINLIINDDYKTYDFLLKVVYDLSIKQKYLIEKYKKCFIGYVLEDIYIIDKKHVIFINKDLFDIDNNNNNNNIFVNSFFDKNNLFYAPEMSNINDIPFYIDYKCSYYSLGLLVIYLLSNGNLSNDKKDILYYLNNSHIYSTDLYFLILRCLNTDSSRRSILYI